MSVTSLQPFERIGRNALRPIKRIGRNALSQVGLQGPVLRFGDRLRALAAMKREPLGFDSNRLPLPPRELTYQVAGSVGPRGIFTRGTSW